jgi:L-cysteine desulfidase
MNNIFSHSISIISNQSVLVASKIFGVSEESLGSAFFHSFLIAIFVESKSIVHSSLTTTGILFLLLV